MKKLLALALIAVFLYSCNKVTENNIVGTWEVKAVTINSIPQTISNVETFVFTDGGTYTYNVAGQTAAAGTYAVNKDAQTILMDGVQTINVTKKGKTMTFNYISSGDSYVVELEKE